MTAAQAGRAWAEKQSAQTSDPEAMALAYLHKGMRVIELAGKKWASPRYRLLDVWPLGGCTGATCNAPKGEWHHDV